LVVIIKNGACIHMCNKQVPKEKKKELTFSLPEATFAKETTPRTTEADVVIGPLYSLASTCFSSK
jgi:hypothetical protein